MSKLENIIIPAGFELNNKNAFQSTEPFVVEIKVIFLVTLQHSMGSFLFLSFID